MVLCFRSIEFPRVTVSGVRINQPIFKGPKKDKIIVLQFAQNEDSLTGHFN